MQYFCLQKRFIPDFLLTTYAEMKQYHSEDGRYFILKVSVLLCSLAAAVICSLLFGAETIGPSALFSPDKDSFDRIILLNIRVPRTILAAASGALLAGAGAAFQLFFRNPLAEPGIMGISSGATLGAVLAGYVSFIPSLFSTVSPVNTGAFCGAVISGILVTALAGKRSGPSSTVALLLCGTALGTLYSSLTSIVLLLREKELHAMYIWMLGSFSGRGWDELRFIALPGTAAFILLLICSLPLDLLAGGEKTAASLGVEVKRLRFLVMTAGALASSAAVCAGGTIGFVGLIAPHIVRRIFGARSRTLIPLSMAAGAVLMVSADTAARLIAAPAEVPVGIITAILGAPFFISLIFSERSMVR
jgi:iron complex transport system permease protein